MTSIMQCGDCITIIKHFLVLSLIMCCTFLVKPVLLLNEMGCYSLPFGFSKVTFLNFMLFCFIFIVYKAIFPDYILILYHH